MADHGIIISGLCLVFFSGVFLLSPIALATFNEILQFDYDKLTTVITIAFFSGLGIIIIGTVSKSRNNSG